MLRIGIDLGGTKIEIIALSDGNEVLLRQRVPTPTGDYLGTVIAIAELIKESEQQLGAQGSIGVGIPGALMAHTGRIKNANSTCLIGMPLQRDLQSVLKREVRLANDANCFALSEASDGAAVGAGVVFGVILGTGVGGGIVVNGSVLTGVNSIAGEWGHNPMPQLAGLPGEAETTPLLKCYCGKSGCVETFLSGSGLVLDYLNHAAPDAEKINPPHIVAHAEAGDAACEMALQRYEARLACALAQTINILDPDVIVLGGGLSNIDRLYLTVPELWSQYVFSDTVLTRLMKNRHGDSSGVRGAAWLWPKS